jgi:hypothetical protein
MAAAIASALADHLPEKLLAHGRPETTLAGIGLETTMPDEVVRRLGPPAKTVRAPNNPYWTGYLWQTANIRIEVEISKGRTRDYIGTVTIVRLGNEPQDAAAKQPDLSTGQGLKLGDTLDTLKKVYGSRLQVDKQTAVPVDTKPFLSVPGVETATIQWTPMEFTLTAGLDAQGKIIALRLRPPSCYPGGCK